MTAALPDRFTDRWGRRRSIAHGQGVVYWHMLVSDSPALAGVVRDAQRRLAPFSGFHFTPLDRLHITTIVAGSTDDISTNRLSIMREMARELLRGQAPVPVSVGRVGFHAEAIALVVSPRQALAPIMDVARHATRCAVGHNGLDGDTSLGWIPHVTVAYSTHDQPSGPIIDALGVHVPEARFVVSSLALVRQWGPEQRWDWEIVESMPFGSPPR